MHSITANPSNLFKKFKNPYYLYVNNYTIEIVIIRNWLKCYLKFNHCKIDLCLGVQ